MITSDWNQSSSQPASSVQPAQGTILLIDDDPEMASMLSTYLLGEGFTVCHAATGTAGLGLACDDTISLVLLDVVLPDIDGFEVLRQLREKSRIPVIMLTMQGAVADRVRGFESGADDYVPKPFSPVEVLARIRSLLRRSQSFSQEQLQLVADDLVLIPTSRTVLREGQQVPCTTSEFDVIYPLP